MSTLPMAAAILAGGAMLAVVLIATWVGFLYHRALRLPQREQEHAQRVLSELTELLTVVVDLGRSKEQEQVKPSRRSKRREIS
ncbi:hypothetical protein AB0C84_15845 [Actinomadura sp. NPDC048955]|uniref:hypothetical protein n=1 Tax=Actinomadura sp. NPDC048955 TaxID=3158228 RepID=UPI0033F3857E